MRIGLTVPTINKMEGNQYESCIAKPDKSLSQPG